MISKQEALDQERENLGQVAKTFQRTSSEHSGVLSSELHSAFLPGKSDLNSEEQP